MTLILPERILEEFRAKFPAVPECSCPHKKTHDKCHPECIIYKNYLERKYREDHKPR